MNSHVRVENLKKSYTLNNKSFLVLNDVSFTVNKGEVYGIIGFSGAGKSTLIRCINRLTEVDEGHIFIENENILKLSNKELNKKRKNIGMIFQNYHLFEQKNVFENIAFPLRLMSLSEQEIEERVTELLEFVSLSEKRYAYPSMLSGGQKQRVAIARALAPRPTLLLSDESTSALDPASAKQILTLLKKSVEVYGMTLIMITHQLEVAKSICDRIAVMDNGKIVEENKVQELFRSPKHPLTIKLINQLPAQDDELDIILSSYKGRIYRLSYDENTVQEPILAKCQKKYNIEINLLKGQINTVNQSTVGTMVVEIQGDKNEIEEAVLFLQSYKINVLEIKK